MTIIVWDGSTLATDRAASDGAAQWRTKKAWYWGEGEDRLILSGAGPLHSILEMCEWFKAGIPQETFPVIQTTHPCHFVVISPHVGLYRYEQSHVPIEHGRSKCAFGEGRAFAYGALHMGADAAQAVAAANEYSPHCGLGIEEYRL
jgi:hypothetical protein